LPKLATHPRPFNVVIVFFFLIIFILIVFFSFIKLSKNEEVQLELLEDPRNAVLCDTDAA
jgi:hypothetical protein